MAGAGVGTDSCVPFWGAWQGMPKVRVILPEGAQQAAPLSAVGSADAQGSPAQGRQQLLLLCCTLPPLHRRHELHRLPRPTIQAPCRQTSTRHRLASSAATSAPPRPLGPAIGPADPQTLLSPLPATHLT